MNMLMRGCLKRIEDGEDIENPIVQIKNIKKMASAHGERYRLLLSDGDSSSTLNMLATPNNHLIENDRLSLNSIVRINRYVLQDYNRSGLCSKIMIICDLEVLVPGDQVEASMTENLPNCNQVNAPYPRQVENGCYSNEIKVEPSIHNPSNDQNPAHAMSQRLNDTVNGGASATPIAALSPYQHRWVIKARVVNKSPIRVWSNPRSEGKLFSMDLVDESGEIRCTAFKDQCDKFYDMIEMGKIYYISRCQLKPANKTFNILNNDYEMSMTNDSEIVPCHEDVQEIPTLQFRFIPISEIEKKAKDEIVDVIGIVKSYSEVQSVIQRSTGRELKKRDIGIFDTSNVMVTVTLWGSEAEKFDGSENPVVAMKGARVTEFNGSRSLSISTSTVLQVDPDNDEAHRLRGWFRSGQAEEQPRTLSKFTGGALNGPINTVMEVQNPQLIQNGGMGSFVVKATIHLFRSENMLYKACPVESCKKKVIDQSNNMFRCEKCQKEYPNFMYRLLASTNLVDWTGSLWATAFNDEAEKILNATARELGELKDVDNTEFSEKVSENAFQTFLFGIRTKMDTYRDETRLKASISGIRKLDYKMYTDHMLASIKDLIKLKATS